MTTGDGKERTEDFANPWLMREMAESSIGKGKWMGGAYSYNEYWRDQLQFIVAVKIEFESKNSSYN